MKTYNSNRTCEFGHSYYKTSSCLTCPVCEAKKKPKIGFLSLLSAPARRALENADIITLEKLSQYTKGEILKLHGVGNSSIPKLELALQNEGLSFKQEV